MGATTGIEWTDATWSPIRARHFGPRYDKDFARIHSAKVGWHCEHVSEGCRNCYAEGINRRLGTGLDFKPGHRDDIEIFLDEKMLLAPLRWKKPRRIFVNSMSDTFAEFVKDEWIDRMFAVMALCPRHTFQVLTKRPERMRTYFLGTTRFLDVHPLEDRQNAICEAMNADDFADLPLPNVWLGVSAEDQATADERIPLLLQIPAKMHFLSVEPLLGPVDLKHPWLGWKCCVSSERAGSPGACNDCDPCIGTVGRTFIDWVIVGGESGPHARPMHPQWARGIRDQCATAGVPYFHKQNGEFVGGEIHLDLSFDGGELVETNHYGTVAITRAHRFDDKTAAVRVGKKAAGRLLDGLEYSEFPAAHAA